MSRTSAKTFAEQYLDALQELEDAMIRMDAVSAKIRKSHRQFKSALKVAPVGTNPNEPK